jgi:hypothetical protein
MTVPQALQRLQAALIVHQAAVKEVNEATAALLAAQALEKASQE